MSSRLLKDVYDAIWEMLVRQDEIRELVKRDNRIKEDPLSLKWNSLDADYPMIRVIPSIISSNMHADSCSSRLTMAYDIQIFAGHNKMQEIFEIYWAVWKAMVRAQTEILDEVQWNADDSYPLRRFDIIEGKFDKDVPGMKGWHTMLRVEADLWFATSTVTAS